MYFYFKKYFRLAFRKVYEKYLNIILIYKTLFFSQKKENLYNFFKTLINCSEKLTKYIFYNPIKRFILLLLF